MTRAIAAGLLLLPTLAWADPIQVEVVRVIDGDSLEIRIPSNEPGWDTFSARLIGVNTAEPRSRCDTEAERETERELAARAENFVMDRIASAETITADRQGEDSLNRALVEVRLDGESLNQALLETGHALPYEEGTKGRQWCGK